MPQFADYAEYYDTVYQDKPYKNEVNVIEQFFVKHLENKPKTILSLGCGTGTYEIELAKRGYRITGVDLSNEMLDKAKAKIANAGLTDDITLVQGDIRKLQLNAKFDVAIMMFNIAGYLRTTTDLSQVAKTVSNHIVDGGIFLFDAWNGVAVELDPPGSREKEVEVNGNKIIRKTSSILDTKNKLVKITFEVDDLSENKEVTEEHPMRYWFKNELIESLKTGNLKLLEMTSFKQPENNVSDQEWDMFVVAKKEE